MAKRGRKRKFKLRLNVKNGTLKSITSVVLVLGGIVGFISFLFPDYSVNEKIQEILRKLFGMPSIFVPLLMIVSGLLFIDFLQLKIKEPRVVFGLSILLLSLSGFFHLFISEDAQDVANNGGGGGLVGFKIASFLKDSISIYGAFFVLLLALISSVILIFDISFEDIFKFISNLGSKLDSSKIKSIFLKKTEESSYSNELEITPGMMSMDTPIPDMEPQTKKEKRDQEEVSIEIVPTMAEPQKGTNASREISTLGDEPAEMPSLPYTDKVWENPPLDILFDSVDEKIDNGDIEQRAKIIVDTLKSFGINTQVVDIKSGPSVTQYSLKTDTGIKISKVSNLQTDLALALASPTGSVRIEAPIPGKALIGIEVPNNKRAIVSFKSLVTSEAMKGMKSKLGIVLGKDVGGRVYSYDISKMPHMLIAGSTGSGKSIFIHNILFSILFKASPQEVKFILIDPKRVELIVYQDIPHLLTPVVTDMDKAPSVFKWAVAEMTRRYVLFEKAKARNIDAYNEKSGFQALPYIVIIVDELGEIMVQDPQGVEKSIIRLAQLARATGIHLVLAVQRPSTNIITGLIKANIPCRVAFNVTSQIDSRVIIDQPGAEKLLGKGDMLFVPPDAPRPLRLQGAFVSETETNKLVQFLKGQGFPTEYKNEIFEMQDALPRGEGFIEGQDPLMNDAADIVVSAGKGSASLLQRKLSIGYTRAARILDELEAKGVVGPAVGSKPRDILSGPPRGNYNAGDTTDYIAETDLH